MLVFWLINIILWVAFAAYNYAFLTKKINFHFWGAVVTCIIAFGIMIICFLQLSSSQIILLPIITLVLRWVVFDISLNLMCSQKWWYYGNITKGLENAKPHLKNGKIDNWLTWKQIPIKAVLLIVVIYLSL